MSIITRVILKVFGRRLNREVFYPVLGRAYECGRITSHQFHELHREFDPTQQGLVTTGRIRLSYPKAETKASRP